MKMTSSEGTARCRRHAATSRPRLAFSFALSLLSLCLAGCENPTSEMQIEMMAMESAIVPSLKSLDIAVRVTERFMGETAPVVGAEVVFSSEFVLTTGTLSGSESPPVITDPIGVAAIRLDLQVVRAGLSRMSGTWTEIIIHARVVGQPATRSMRLPVHGEPPGSGELTATGRSHGQAATLWKEVARE